MQTQLQDLAQYWPVLGELSPAVRRHMQHEIAEQVPAILALAVALIAAWGTALLKWGAMAFFSMFLISLAHLRLRNRRSDAGKASIEFGKLKVSWQGSLALGFLVAGLVLLILNVGIWYHQGT